jgi:hypothetical protein
MSFSGFCKKLSGFIFALVILWLITSSMFVNYLNILFIIVLSSGILCLFLYGLGAIVENLQKIYARLTLNDPVVKNEIENDNLDKVVFKK